MVYLDRFAISIFENRGLDFERAKIQPPIFASGPSVSGPGILGGYEGCNQVCKSGDGIHKFCVKDEMSIE